MITFPNSFQNANGDEGSAIGRLFWDREISNTYVEVAQAEDYVLFRLVHESEDQRYGFEQFRKVREFRVTVTAMPAVTDIIRAGVSDEGEEYTSVSLWDEHGEGDIGFALTEQGITIGCTMGSTKLLKVRLDNDDTDKLCYLLEAFFDDYQNYLNRRAFVDLQLDDWRYILEQLNGSHPADVIECAIIQSSVQKPSDVVTVEFYDSAEAERVTELQMHEFDWSVSRWRGVLKGLRMTGEEDLLRKIADELDFNSEILDDDPRGCTSRTELTMRLNRDEDTLVQRAAFIYVVNR